MNYVAGREEDYPRKSARSPREERGGDVREKRSVKLELLGRRFTVKSDDDDAYIQELVDFINGKLHEIRESTGKVEADAIALLAVLDIADALFREREKCADLKQQIRARSEQLLEAIDKVATTVGGSQEIVREVHARAETNARGR